MQQGEDDLAISRREALLRGLGATAIGGLSVAAMAGAPAFAAGHDRGPAERGLAFNALDFGAKGDGKTDDTAAIQGALRAAGQSGGTVFLPGAVYLIGGTLEVPQSVSLRGTFEAPPRTGPGGGGTVLLATAGRGQETGTPFILLRTNSTVRGLSVFYPEQTSDIAPYPPTIQGFGDDCSIVDVLLINPYFGVDVGTNPCGRHWIKSLYMQALRRGIYVAECFDVGRIEDIHIWPFWRAGDPKIDGFVHSEGEAFVLARTDWEYMQNCFCIGYHTGYRFTTSKSGPGNVVLTQCGSDEGPQSTSVLVEETQGHAGVSFVNGQFMGQTHVDVREQNNGPVKFTACGFWGLPGITGSMANLAGAGQVIFEGCHFTGWALAGDPSAPAIVAEAGGLSVVSCDFMDSGKQQVRIGAKMDSAVVVANRLRGGERIDNQIGDRAQIGLNATG
jgi:hypothetical protein